MITADGKSWLLLNASPDLPRQIERYLPLSPDGPIRQSPFAEVFLTNADLDHALGLLLLREGSALKIIAPLGVQDTLANFLRFDQVLGASCGATWKVPGEEWQPSALPSLEFKAVPLSQAKAPRFAPSVEGCHGVGYLLRESGKRNVVGFFPDAAELDEPLLETLRQCQVIFFDGTFWDEDELAHHDISPRTARQMGHLPVSHSKKWLALLAAQGIQIYYLHINNTNPILDPKSAPQQELETAGLRVAEDGLRLKL